MTLHKQTARLLLQGLSDADTDQVQAVVNTTRGRTFNEWQLVDCGDADLALIGTDEPTTVLGLLDDPIMTFQVVEPGARGSGRYCVLATPLRYVALADVLTDVDRRLAMRRALISKVRENGIRP